MSDDLRKVSRRSFLGKVVGGTALGAVAVIAGVGAAGPAQAQTDSDPYDPVGRGRGSGITDSDPYDPVGRGRGRRYRRRRRGSGITDRDPYDPVGNGRRCTDRDPYDPVGRGRWCRR